MNKATEELLEKVHLVIMNEYLENGIVSQEEYDDMMSDIKEFKECSARCEEIRDKQDKFSNVIRQRAEEKETPIHYENQND